MGPETSRARTDSEIPHDELDQIARGIQQEKRDRIRRANRELFDSITALFSPEERALYAREGRAPIDLL